jgi:hypothetical protein
MSLSPALPAAVRVPKEAVPDALAEDLEKEKLSLQLALLEAVGWLSDVEFTGARSKQAAWLEELKLAACEEPIKSAEQSTSPKERSETKQGFTNFPT